LALSLVSQYAQMKTLPATTVTEIILQI
jgi:hypothetical protein